MNKHIEAFKIVLYNNSTMGSKWSREINQSIYNKMNKLVRVYRTRDRRAHKLVNKHNSKMYHEYVNDIEQELQIRYYVGKYNKKFDATKSSLMTYTKIFINSHLKELLRKERKAENMSYNNDEYDDQVFYPGENSDLQSEYEVKEKIDLLHKYATDHDKLNEFEVLVGLKDYDDFTEKCSKEYHTMRQRVSRLRKDFEDYYETI